MRDIIATAKRTPYQSLASLLILFFTLFLSLFFFNITSFFYSILDYVETRPQVTVYFSTKTQEPDIVKIKQAIEESGKASKITYISQEQAFKIYKDLNRDNPLLLEMVSADILPASLEIYAAKPEFLSEIATFLQKQPAVDEVGFQKDIVDKLLALTKILRRVSLALFAFLLVTSVVVLITTTAFKIALKKDEIELLQLLGASTFYVRQPFLKEGIVFGLLSASIAYLVFMIIFISMSGFLTGYLSELPRMAFYGLSNLGLYVWPPSWQYALLSYLLIAFFGMGIGFVGTYAATSKYIK